MKYFIDTHDKTKESFPQEAVTEAQFIEVYGGFDKACEDERVTAVGAHVNLEEGKAFCFTTGPDKEAVRRAHEKIAMPFDSITEVRRVTGVDLR